MVGQSRAWWAAASARPPQSAASAALRATWAAIAMSGVRRSSPKIRVRASSMACSRTDRTASGVALAHASGNARRTMAGLKL